MEEAKEVIDEAIDEAIEAIDEAIGPVLPGEKVVCGGFMVTKCGERAETIPWKEWCARIYIDVSQFRFLCFLRRIWAR
jgi:hypothetical protein